MSNGSEFQVCGAATENARRGNSVRVLAANSIGASEDRRGQTGTADCIRLFRYAGVDDERTLRPWYVGRPWPWPHCVRWGPSSPPKKRGTAAPHCSAHVYCGQMGGWIKMPLGTEVGLSQATGAQQHPTFRPMTTVAKQSPISALLYII